ncbi:MAG: c-type cytochrome, partial [Planctomycetaceae bacterium]|nr:c-type cytochrome [Planctomycetaceae bacterium]
MSFRSLVTPLRTPALRVVLQVLVSVTSAHLACAEDFDAARVYEQEVQPLLEKHCYNCHGNGAREGALALDRFKTPAAANSDPELWWQVLKNLRAGVMPPASSSTLSPEEMERITSWIKFGPFGIDPAKPDPGPITVRRLNREEY